LDKIFSILIEADAPACGTTKNAVLQQARNIDAGLRREIKNREKITKNINDIPSSFRFLPETRSSMTKDAMKCFDSVSRPSV